MNTKLKKVQKAYDNFVLPFQGDITDKDLELSLKRAKKLYQVTIELYEDKVACLEAKRYLDKHTTKQGSLDIVCTYYKIEFGLCFTYQRLVRFKLYGKLNDLMYNLVSPGCYYKGDKGPFRKPARKKIIHSLELRVELIDKLLKLLK